MTNKVKNNSEVKFVEKLKKEFLDELNNNFKDFKEVKKSYNYILKDPLSNPEVLDEPIHDMASWEFEIVNNMNLLLDKIFNKIGEEYGIPSPQAFNKLRDKLTDLEQEVYDDGNDEEVTYIHEEILWFLTDLLFMKWEVMTFLACECPLYN